MKEILFNIDSFINVFSALTALNILVFWGNSEAKPKQIKQSESVISQYPRLWMLIEENKKRLENKNYVR